MYKTQETPPLLEIEDLSVVFRSGGFASRRKTRVHAVSNVSLHIAEGETVALVGESGSGKSTIGKAVCGLVPYEGRIRLAGQDLSAFTGRRSASAARLRQMVFQDPYSSLDPTMPVEEIIAEPLRRLEKMRQAQRQAKVADLLDAVQLPRSFGHRLPAELSGGQRQRVAIARAIAIEPPLVICDEAVSALDVSTQRGVIELLEKLRTERNLAYLFISHDLSVVRSVADRVAVMYFGSLVEEGPTEAVFSNPAHPYTKALLEAAPIPDPRRQRQRTRATVRGELPDPTRPPSGCSFHPRCPSAMEICRTVAPRETTLDSGVAVRCHLHLDPPVSAQAELVERETVGPR
jgi:oligopeptide/dipeptide ABC transporter ATP-binding protein